MSSKPAINSVVFQSIILGTYAVLKSCYHYLRSKAADNAGVALIRGLSKRAESAGYCIVRADCG